MIVWEGFFGLPSDQYSPLAFKVRERFHCYRSALGLYFTNGLAISAAWQLWEDRDIEIVSYLPQTFRQALKERLSQDALPYRSLSMTTPTEMARTLALRTDQTRLIDPETSRLLAYGPKAMVIAPENAHMIYRSL